MIQPLPSDASVGGLDGGQHQATARQAKKKLGEMLVDAGLLTAEQMERALQEAREGNMKLGELLVTKRLVTEQDIAMVLSLQLSVPLIDLKRDCPAPRKRVQIQCYSRARE